MAFVRALLLSRALDCVGGDLVHGLSVAGVGNRLLCCILVKDRPPRGEAPTPRIYPEPAQKACAGAAAGGPRCRYLDLVPVL